MTTTAGLGLETISESQIQKFQTHNDALDQIDRAFTALLAVDVSAGNATITSLQARSNQVLACSGASVAGRTVTLPAVTRMLIFTLDLASTESVSVVRGSTSFAVAPGESVFVYADGSADGLLVLGTGAIAGSSTVIMPIATASVLGGIKVGAGLSITAPGVLSLNLDTIGNTQGDILYRDGSAWTVLGAGTAGQVLQSGGAGANPSWATGSYSLPAATDAIRGGVTVPTAGGLALSGDALSVDTTSIATKAYADGLVANLPYDLALYVEGLTTASESLLRFTAPRAFSLAAGASGQATAGTAATGSTVLALAKNGSSIGTVTWAAAGTVATISITSTTAFAVGDVLTVTGPATPDATLAGLSVTLAATRS